MVHDGQSDTSLRAPFGSARGGLEDRYRAIADLHARSIDRGFLPSLGIRFLAAMYRCMDEDPSTILLVEEADGEIIGFVSATRGTRPLRSILMRHPVRVSLALLPSCVVPWRLAGMLAVARYERRGGPPIAGLPRAELLSIAVAESHRGKGVAERLFRRLEDAFRADGIREFRIVVGAGLVPASRFYIRMGAREAGRFRLHDGEDSLVYVRTISA